MEQCKQNFHHNKSILQLFDTLPKDYFVRYEEEEIIWHLWTIDKYQDKQIIVSSRISEHNVVDVFVYSDDTSGLFYKLISIIERLGLNVVDAKIVTTKANMAYNTISILRDKIIDQIDLNKEIEKGLSSSIIDAKRVGDKLKHRHFDSDLKITFSRSEKWNLTQLEINVLDKQGLLSNIAYIFYKLNINLINARISTLGERVEDVFFISNKNNNFLDVDEKNLLKEMLKERL